MEVMEGCMATLQCQLSKKASVEWKKGPEPLRDGDRYRLRQTGTMCELQIHDLTMADAGEYSCMCGEDKTTAMLTIKGKDLCGGTQVCVSSAHHCGGFIPASWLCYPEDKSICSHFPTAVCCVGFVLLDPVSLVLPVMP